MTLGTDLTGFHWTCPSRIRIHARISSSLSSQYYRPIASICAEFRKYVAHADFCYARVEHGAPVSLLDAPLIHGILWEPDGENFQIIGVGITSAGYPVAGPRAVRAAVFHEVAASHVQAVLASGFGQIRVEGERGATHVRAGLVDEVDQRLHIFRVLRVCAVACGLLNN